MDLRVQYAKTDDGVDIAFAVLGEGPPLVIAPNLSASHLQLGMELPMNRSFIERLSRRLQLILYDARGVGMSQRDRADFSAEGLRRDIAAVADRLGLERFALYSHTVAGPGPRAFAAAFPERVTCLVEWVGQTIRDEPERLAQAQAVQQLADSNWDLFTRIMGRVIFGWDSQEATPYAAIVRAGSSPTTMRSAIEAIDIGREPSTAADVHVPALVAHVQGAEIATDRARALASRMPNAHVIAVPGAPKGLFPFVYDNEVLIAAIVDFVEAAWSEPAAAVAAPVLNLSAMRAILFTDIEGHTSLMQRLGDERGRAVLREHEQLTRTALGANGGTEVKAMGDGFMAWFSSAQQALACATGLQRAFAERNRSAKETLRVRVGVNAGEPIVEEDDLFGASVIAAARICREADGGEVVVSDVVRQLVAGKGFVFADHGETLLKGFEEPVRLHAVRWRDGG